MRRLIFIITFSFFLFPTFMQAQVQWASKVIDFSSEYKDEVIRENSTRWSASQVLGYPNCTKYGSSQLAWTPKSQDNSKEFITVGFAMPQTVQQVIVGENYNAGSISEIILYDNKGKKITVYENDHPTPTQKFNDILTYFKIKPTYNVVKLKLVLNTNAVLGRQEIDCIGISSTTAPYKQNINVIKYSEPVGQPENLGPNINSQYYDHLPLISPDGSLLYFTRKLIDDKNPQQFNDDIYVAHILPTGQFSKAENIGPPLNTSDNNFACFISSDNNRLYVANKYIKNTYNYAGLSVSTKQKDGSWSKPKALPIPDLYNKNEFAHYHLNLDENVVLMAIQRDDSYGDLDLYVSQKYSDGDWTAPKNLGPVINTVGAEGSVFLAADGRTLYFSSTGQPGFGSYDMYMSKRLDDTWTNWSKPLNLGDKINTDEMDIYYTIPASGDYAYFSSGVTYFGNNDLYRIKLPKEARPDYVDIKKFVAKAPLSKQSPVVNAQPTPTQPTVVAPSTVAPTSPVKPTVSQTTLPPQNNSQTDELQKKLDELKRQQSQIDTKIPPKTNIPENPQAVASTPISTQPVVKREIVNTVQPYQNPDDLKPKPSVTNTVKPAAAPAPAPRILTKEELAAREQQKLNPTINPNNDRLNTITKSPMPIAPAAPPTNNQRQEISNPNIVTNEVDPNALINSEMPTTTMPSNTLKTTTPQVDELQQKLDALKQQQSQVALNSSAPTTSYSTPTETKSVRELYPNPQPIMPTSNAKTDNLEQKLEALKQQQQQVGQSNKLYGNPYEAKPYDAQPLKERQDDVASQNYDDYQKKLEELKQQQKNIPTLATKNNASEKQAITPTPTNTVVAKQEPVTPVATTNPSASTNVTNPIISKYEEKLKNLQDEMALYSNPTVVADTKLAEPTIASVTTPIQEKTTATSVETVPINLPTNTEVIPKDSAIVEDISPVKSISPNELDVEQQKLDSIQQAQKTAEKKMTETLDKMGSNKQDLEKDIADLKEQRTKFNDEKDKLTAQNSQLSGEKDKLEAEKKKMDDLLAQMQTQYDKLAAEKLKMEQDRAKLDLLKKQQERNVLDLKHTIDSLDKVKQQSVNNAKLQQKYDLFDVPLQVGAIAQVNNIYFVADAAFLQIPSYPELDKVVLFLERNKKLRVEIGGHTNGLCDDYFCQKLSTSRAKTCVDYLVSKGISANRLSYKGYGKTQLLKPEDPSNPLNQRVEIKIISIDN